MKLTSPLDILILRHPQEKDKTLGTAPLLEKRIKNVTIKTGLSTANLQKAFGKPTQNTEWAVLFLGSLKPDPKKEITIYNKNKKIISLEDAREDVRGIILLDGSWQQAKALWWRNPWLLKISRIVLNPTKPSLYGKLRKGPKKICLSTLESAALIIKNFSDSSEVSDALLNDFKVLLEEFKNPKNSDAPLSGTQPSAE